MAFKHGKDFAFLSAASDLSAFCDGIEWSRSRDTSESTTAGAAEDTKTYVAGQRDNSFTISGKFDSTASTGPRAVLNGDIDSDASVSYTIRQEGTGSSLPQNIVSAFCTGYSESIPVGGVVTFSASFQCTGAVNETAQSA